jgi:hypothetical protein
MGVRVKQRCAPVPHGLIQRLPPAAPPACASALSSSPCPQPTPGRHAGRHRLERSTERSRGSEVSITHHGYSPAHPSRWTHPNDACWPVWSVIHQLAEGECHRRCGARARHVLFVGYHQQRRAIQLLGKQRLEGSTRAGARVRASARSGINVEHGGGTPLPHLLQRGAALFKPVRRRGVHNIAAVCNEDASQRGREGWLRECSGHTGSVAT